MEVRYLNKAEWQALMLQRKQEQQAIDAQMASGALNPEDVFSFGRELAKRAKIRWDLDQLNNITL
jgi:hypothetical protein